MYKIKKINSRTNAKILTLFLIVIINVNANSADFIPIAEYCVVYETKKFCDCETDSANVYLRLENVLQERFDIAFCTGSENYDFYWIRKFLIHDDLKVERIREGINIGYDGTLHTRKYIHHTTIAEWYFVSEVPIYTKNTNWVDSNKYGKYYKKGKIIPVEWQLKAKCDSYYETTYSGSYFIRITGECK